MKKIIVVLLALMCVGICQSAQPGSLEYSGCIFSNNLNNFYVDNSLTWSYDFWTRCKITAFITLTHELDLYMWETTKHISLTYTINDTTSLWVMSYTRYINVTKVLDMVSTYPLVIGITKKIW